MLAIDCELSVHFPTKLHVSHNSVRLSEDVAWMALFTMQHHAVLAHSSVTLSIMVNP